MRVDAPGLVAAAQRLIAAVEALGAGGGVPHPPLAADPTSVGAAARLTTAGAELSAALGAHVAALLASAEVLTGAALSYVATEEINTAAVTRVMPGTRGGAGLPGAAPPPPPVPADVRAPLAPPAGLMPEAIAVATHAGSPGAGDPFIQGWQQVAEAARGGADAIRSTVAQLPDTLDGPASTPAVSRHLLSFAAGLDTYADRATTLVNQAVRYADNQIQAREDVPTPQQLSAAYQRVQTLSYANAASGGKWAAQLAAAVADRNQLDQQAVSGHQSYHVRTDAATAGDDPGAGDPRVASGASGPTPGDAAGDGSGQADPAGQALSPESGGQMASLLPQLVPTLLGAAGGLVGGAVGALAKGPEAVMQAGMQAVSAATQGLSGLGQGKPELPGGGPPGGPDPGGVGDPGGAGGAGDAAVTPAGGGGDLGVAPSTGGPPTPAVAPAGAAGGPGSSPAAGGGAGMPVGMPMGGLAGAPGGSGGGEGKGAPGRPQKVETREIPHTEDVTGRVDTNRLSAAAAATSRERGAGPASEDDPPDPGGPIVRRLVTRPPREPS